MPNGAGSNEVRMSDELKMHLITQLGYGDVVRRDGDFGNVPARACGSMVKLAIQLAEQQLSGQR